MTSAASCCRRSCARRWASGREIPWRSSGPSGSSPSPGGGGGGTIDVDSALSTTSTNPVQNKVITAALNSKVDEDEEITILDVVNMWNDT